MHTEDSAWFLQLSIIARSWISRFPPFEPMFFDRPDLYYGYPLGQDFTLLVSE